MPDEREGSHTAADIKHGNLGFLRSKTLRNSVWGTRNRVSEEVLGPGVSPPPRGQNGIGNVHISPPEGAKDKQITESMEEAVSSISLIRS